MIDFNQRQPRNPAEDIRGFFLSGSALSILILINLAVWFIIQVARVLFFFAGGDIADALPAFVLQTLGVPAYLPALVQRPWTLLTYMFLHIDIWHILFNLLWLYWFGKIFLEFLPARKLVWVYLLGGLSGGVFYILAFNTFPVFGEMVPVSRALGASASVMAIVAATAFYVPNYTINLLFVGRLKILYLAVILFVFDFFMIPSGNSGGHLAHIGGALFGAGYALAYKRLGRQSGSWASFLSGDLFGRNHRRGAASGTGGNTRGRPETDDEYNARKVENQRKIDEILEKISKGGYDSLTRDEKDFLFRSSGKR